MKKEIDEENEKEIDFIDWFKNSKTTNTKKQYDLMGIINDIMEKEKELDADEFMDEEMGDEIYSYPLFMSEEIEKEDAKYNFPILKSQAVQIAYQNENLKTDYCRNAHYRKNISFLSFKNQKIDIVEIENKKYWQIQVLDGDVSGMEVSDESVYNWDGYLDEDDLNLLRCLVDTETGEYIYYPVPKEKFMRKIFKKIFKK